MTECDVFIDYSEVRDGCLAQDVNIGGVRYRKRPPDKGCLHPSVTFGTPDMGMVDCACDNPECGLEWRMVKVHEPKESGR